MGEIEIKIELNKIADRLKAIANELGLKTSEPSVSEMTKTLEAKLDRKELCHIMQVADSTVSAWIHDGGINSKHLKNLRALYRKTFGK